MAFKLSSLVLVATLVALLALGGAGCTSAGQPASASFASVMIKGHSAQEIANVTTQVFRKDGYAGGGGFTGGPIIFLKEASRMKNLAYEGVAGSFYGAQTLVKVAVELVNLGGDSYRLQCQAYIVTGAGDAFFQEEKRQTNVRSGPYRSLLNQVAEQLK